ncbi:MAG: energy transducer TonB family protein, partial [Deferrisomatales bacterium]
EAAEALARAVPSPPPPASPPVRVPRRELRLPEPDVLPWVPPSPPGPEPARRAPAPRLEAPPGPAAAEAAELARALLRQAAPAAPSPVSPPRAESTPRLDIQWAEGAARRVVVEPPLPGVQFRHAADVSIRFWVSHRGEVLRALPTQRGDPELDAAALAYVKGFRFNPLPPGQEHEQWGTIRVRFRF